MQAWQYEPATIKRNTIMTNPEQIRMTDSGAIRLTDDDSSIGGGGALQCEAEQQTDAKQQQKRHKKVEKEKDSSSALTSTKKPLTRLTANQRAFAEHLAAGMNQTEAYIKAYNVRTTNRNVISINASRLARDNRISMLLESFTDSIAERVVEDSVKTRRFILEELHGHASNAKTATEKLRALELMGRAIGMFTDKVETKVEAISTEQLKKELRNHLVLLDNVRPMKTVEIITEDAICLNDDDL
jgi:hypothetical protein